MLTLSSVVLLALLAGASTSIDGALTRQSVDLIELNHFVDEEGREVFQQVIFYDWSAANRRYHVRAWRLVKAQNQLPVRYWNPRRYQCTWHEDGVMRQVTAATMRETWTQQDPERANRKFLPEDQRIPLWPAKIAMVDNRADNRTNNGENTR